MAYVKIKPVYKTIQKSIDYIIENEKTDHGIYVSRFNCIKGREKIDFFESLYQNGSFIKRQQNKKKNIIAHHIVQSFKEDEASISQAHEIGRQLIEEVFENQYKVIISTHSDKKNIHNHILLCPVNMETNKRFYGNKSGLKNLREASDRLCLENNLSVIQTEKQEKNKTKGYYEYTQNAKKLGYKVQLEKLIDEIINSSANFEDFKKNMENANCIIEESKSGKIKFKLEGRERFLRGETIGEMYSKEGIIQRINEGKKESISEKEKKYKEKWKEKKEKASFNYNWTKLNQVKENLKEKTSTFREHLKNDIESAMGNAKNYDDFLYFIRKQGYEIKEGKNLAFKGKNQEKYVWAKSLGTAYSEWEIRRKIKNLNRGKIFQGLVNLERAEEKGIHYSNWALIENTQRAINAYHIIQSCEVNLNYAEGDLLRMDEKMKENNEFLFIMQKEIERQREILNAVNQFICTRNSSEVHGDLDYYEILKENAINLENAELYQTRIQETIHHLEEKKDELMAENRILKENKQEVKESVELLKDYVQEKKEKEREKEIIKLKKKAKKKTKGILR